jgi:SOS-response transcriptional repressor LexA
MSKPIEIEEHWPDWKREIATRLNELGMSMKVASLGAELGETWVRDALKREKNPTHRNLTKIREFLGLPDRADSPLPSTVGIQNLRVIGRAQAGAFLDVSLMDDAAYGEEEIQVASSPKYPHARQYALLAVGDSMNKIFDDGSYVTCVNWADIGMAAQVGMVLHVERHQGSLTEVTLKCLEMVEGRLMLVPKSTNPVHKPIPLAGDEGTEIIIKGLVTGAWKPIVF